MTDATTTVRAYCLNGTFLTQEPGASKTFQQAFREHIGDLPNRLVDLAVGIYDVQVSNDRIRIYYLPDVLDTDTLDQLVIDSLEKEVQQGKITISRSSKRRYIVFGSRNLKIGIWENTERTDNRLRIWRLTHEQALAELANNLL